jgi:hypothetical protein
MFATLGFSPASLKPPDRMLEKGGKAGSVLETGSAEDVEYLQ